MQSALKREFLFWLAAAVICGGYLALGHWLTPDVPDQPDYSTDADGSPAVIRVDGRDAQKAMMQIAQRAKKIEAEWKEKKQNQMDFLRRWYQWGAGIGVGMVLLYTWWRPPWRDSLQTQNSDSTTPQKKQREKTVSPKLPVSRTALLGVMAVLLAGIVLLTVIAAMSQ